jgi:hypothetical protein
MGFQDVREGHDRVGWRPNEDGSEFLGSQKGYITISTGCRNEWSSITTEERTLGFGFANEKVWAQKIGKTASLHLPCLKTFGFETLLTN